MRRQPAGYRVVVIGRDDGGGVALQRRCGVGDGEGCVGGLEQADVVVAVAEHHEPAAMQFRPQADQVRDAALLGGSGVVDGQPVPAGRVGVLEAVGADGGGVPLVDRRSQRLKRSLQARRAARSFPRFRQMAMRGGLDVFQALMAEVGVVQLGVVAAGLQQPGARVPRLALWTRCLLGALACGLRWPRLLK